MNEPPLTADTVQYHVHENGRSFLPQYSYAETMNIKPYTCNIISLYLLYVLIGFVCYIFSNSAQPALYARLDNTRQTSHSGTQKLVVMSK